MIDFRPPQDSDVGDRKLLRELTGHRLAEDRVAIPITGAGGSRNSPRNRPLAGWLRAGP
jgi:hypothetical protein